MADHAPRVALTTTALAAGGAHQRPGVFLYSRYIEVLEHVGLAPVLLTPAHSLRAVESLLETCSGLILSGGEDVAPALYGEEPSPALGSVNPARDALELCAIEVAMRRRMPILGICRGCQVLNVALGGTLYQDIDSEMPGGLPHEQTAPWGMRSHHVRIETPSRLHTIVGSTELHINSYHHQSIKDVAPTLRVTARAEDGTVEAVEAVDYPWLLGVQWHPERYEASVPETDADRSLFREYAAEVEAWSGGGVTR